MFEWLRNLFRRQPQQAAYGGMQKEEGPVTIRRFDAALTDQRNRIHWAHASGQSINTDLDLDLDTLVSRCAYEVANNTIFEGVVDTYCNDVVGPHGPLLQIDSESEQFNAVVEAAWRQVFAMPDPAGKLGGVENMKLWVRGLLTSSGFLNIFANVNRPSGLSFGWRTVHTRRLRTPPEFVSDPQVAFGVRFDEIGKPLTYYVEDSRRAGTAKFAGPNYRDYPADICQHRYYHKEPEQLTGYPQMAPALGTMADTRDYNKDVMAATQNAAVHAVGLQCQHPELVTDPVVVPEPLTISRGSLPVAPAGWGFSPFTATQPSAQYRDFVHEKAREVGRAIHMPLTMVLLSTQDTNFAGSQFEGTIYSDGIAAAQSFLDRLTLDQLVEEIVTELVILGRVPRIPYTTSWTHNVPANPNVERFAKAMRVFIEDGVLSQSDVAAALGRDFEAVVRQRRRDADLQEDAGLPGAPSNSGGGRSPTTAEQVEELASADRFARS